VRLEALGQLKNAVTSSGIEPATFRLVPKCLNQLRNRAFISWYGKKSFKKINIT
jgi:hypothetical protein